MKEYGGYIELEYFQGEEYYKNAYGFNSGRSCLAHLIHVKKIQKIYMPYYVCDSVIDVCNKNGIEIEYYNIDNNFKPVFNKQIYKSEYLYLINFYGMLNDIYIREQKQKYNNIIVDNAQAFFAAPVVGVDTIYVPRKFFGVPDGGYLLTNDSSVKEYEVDKSYNKMTHLLGRFEETGSKFYEDYRKNEDIFDNEQIKLMSKLTHNILRAINYESVKSQRSSNYEYLHKCLQNANLLKLELVEGAFAYPFLCDNGHILRKIMHQNNIYIPQLWPDVERRCCEESLEYYYAQNILPIPVDQRYNTEDMQHIVDVLLSNL